MKILLDECVDRRLVRFIRGHMVKTVPQQGWQAYKNGALLRAAQREYDVFVTVDRNLYFQQPVKNLRLTVIILCAPTNRLTDLLPLVPEITRTLKHCKKGEIYFLKARG